MDPIDRVSGLSAKDFYREFVRASRPVILTDFAAGWPALHTWTLDSLKSRYGHLMVPLYDDSVADVQKSVNEPDTYMPLSEYIDLLTAGPTRMRIFLYNIFKNAPELCRDYFVPETGLKIMESLPMMFFGGAGSSVFLHYDMDLSHVFHTHFHGRKEALLFAPGHSRALYRMPLGVHNLDSIDMENPDFDRFPALRNVTGIRAELTPGDTLYMPSGWWHYMKYIDGGWSLSLRAIDRRRPFRVVHGAFNVFVLRRIDDALRKLAGASWQRYKEHLAISRARRLVTAG